MPCLNRNVATPAIASLLLLFNMPIATAFDGDVYDVGIGVVDITPDYPIRLNGFGNRREESEGVSQRIFARAMAISQGHDAPLVLVVLDSLGIRTPMVDAAAERLSKSHDLPRSNLAVTFSHSHCTPKVNGACDNIFSSAIPPEHQQHIDRYTKELTGYIADAAAAAIDSRKPSTLSWAVGEVKFAKNRRDVGGVVDHDLPMLLVNDLESRKPRAIYVSYACHAVTLSFNQVSGDWPGYAAAMIERQVPGVTAMVSIGAGSDQNPLGGVTGDKVDVAAQQGIEISTEVERLLAEDLRTISGTPASVLNEIVLPLNDLPTREQLIEQTGKGRPTDKYNATTQLARLDRGEKLLSQIDYPIQTWTFGDSFCMTFLAGEVCVDYAVRLKSELDRDRFWLNTYSNDFCSYIPSERLAKEGRYGGGAEVPYFALPATLKAGLESLIVDEVHRQVPDHFNAAAKTQGVAPKSPKDSLQSIRTHANLDVKLAAAEPQVTDPVTIDFGPDGRVWVAEMNDYGKGVYESFAQTGRVRWLKDIDGDGQFENAETFVDGLRFPTDVKVWRDGVLICDAPDIVFARDTNGDGTADSVEKLFSGFEVRNAQARVNSLRFGLDNWVYGAGGLFGGNILSHKTGETVNCANRDFRINPDTGEIQPASGRTQQGRCRNDRGDWFGCSNGTLLRAISSDESYSGNNPFMTLASPQLLNVDATAHKLIPPENLVTFELSGVPGKATSACGLGIYRDTVLGEAYHNDAFTCEPVHQSVHRICLSERGHGFVGDRGEGEEDREFLSSSDRWFRPVQARTGPDGALWIVDMYRYVIEHPRWIPQSTLAEVDVTAGKGRGRIYRVLPKSSASSNQPIVPDLTKLSNSELVHRLNDRNGTVRDLAHQMLLWRNSEDVAAKLGTLIESGENELAAMHALSILDGLSRKTQAAAETTAAFRKGLETAFGSEQPELQRFAVKVAERFSTDQEIAEDVLRLTASESVRVRRQAALTLSLFTSVKPNVEANSTSTMAKSIAAMMSQNEADPYVRSAAISSISESTIDDVAEQFLALPSKRQTFQSLRELTLMAAKIGSSGTVNATIGQLNASARVDADLWTTLLNALDARGVQSPVKPSESVADALAKIHREAFESLRNEEARPHEITPALTLLGRHFGAFTEAVLDDKTASISAEQRVELMSQFLNARYPAQVQVSAVNSIATTGAKNITDVLLDSFATASADAKTNIIDALMQKPDATLSLLSAVSGGTIRPDVFDATRRERLLNHSNETIRVQARRILGADRQTTRSAVVAELSACLKLSADAKRGQAVFRKRCSSCHKLENFGFDVGPNLQALTNRDPQWLLTAILDPNRDVDARYVSWTAATVDGRSASGLIVDESAASVRLRESGGKEHQIARTEIEEFRSSQKSVMPEGLERDLSEQDLRDVIEFVSGLASTTATVSNPDAPLPRRAPEIAPFLLDETQTMERRQQAIDRRPGMGPAIISLLTHDIPAGDFQEEYRRIPWIWRVAIAVGKRNDGGEIRDLLEVSVPPESEPLRDWQAVVIGGGLINGAGQLALWPNARLSEILEGLPHVKSRWDHVLELSAAMADDTRVKPGTRYDALRMVALRAPDIAVPHLKRYLTADTPKSLQMGAVSGLADIDTPEAAELLIQSLKFLVGRNRELALEGLLRSDARAERLIQEVSSGRVKLTAAEAAFLNAHPVKTIRNRAVRF